MSLLHEKYNTPDVPRRGFTLIELLIVVAVLGLAGAMLIPHMGSIAGFEVEGAARKVVADLSFAQSDAVARQARRRVHFETDGTGYRLLADPFDYDNDVLFDPLSFNGDGTYIVDFATDSRFAQISIESISMSDASTFITYDEMGGPVDSSGDPVSQCSVVIAGGNGEKYRVVISAFTGRLSVEPVVEE